MYYRLNIFIAVIIGSGGVYGQTAGEQSYDFVNIPYTARITSLGGNNISAYGEDVNVIFSNPSAVSDSMSGSLSVNYLNYFADASLSSFAYVHTFKKYGTFSIGAQRMNLGDFQGYDDSGNPTAIFNSGSTLILIGHSRKVNNFRIGLDLKLAFSTIAHYRSSALMFDIGGMFVHPSKQVYVGMTIKNLGFTLSEFTETNDSVLPFDVQLGVTFKPEHMPFRFSLTAMNFAKTRTAYFDPNDGVLSEEPGIVDKALMHLIIGTELLIGKNVIVRGGYNHKVRKELRLDQVGGGAGFSFGFAFKIKTFELAYGHGGYHPAGGSNNFTITTNVGKMINKSSK